MCYDVAAGTKSALKYAKHRGDDPEMIAELEKQLQLWINTSAHFHAVSGFAHPHLLVFTDDKPYTPQSFQWGLIPFWVKQKSIAATLMNQTLNARAESMFDKPSFRESAKHKRCLVYVDAFYEYHHFNGKTFPYHIAMKDGSPMVFAGLWDEWTDRETGEVIPTVSIVTIKGNEIMSRIHNNPKLNEARMPAILLKSDQNQWLQPVQTEEDELKLTQWLQPIASELLECHTVRRLKGKEALGNVPEAAEEFIYQELSSFS